LSPKGGLEIGTSKGGTLFLFSRVADPEGTLISVDILGGYPKWKARIYRAFAKGGQRILLIKNDSHDPGALKIVEMILEGRKLDFLFIDGDHSYEGVKMDFEMYSPLVRRGGIIAFHDIVPDYYIRFGIKASAYTGGVPKFWSEIKDDYEYLEIIKDQGQNGYGIGVLFV